MMIRGKTLLPFLLVFLIGLNKVYTNDTISITGVILDSDSIPIPNVHVKLMHAQIDTTTDSNGVFHIFDVVSRSNLQKGQLIVNPYLKNGLLKFSISDKMKVAVQLFNSKGVKIKTILNRKLKKGAHSFNITKDLNIAAGVYFLALKMGNTSKVLKLVVFKNSRISSTGLSSSLNANQPLSILSMNTATIDTLLIDKKAFYSTKIPIPNYVTNLDTLTLARDTMFLEIPATTVIFSDSTLSKMLKNVNDSILTFKENIPQIDTIVNGDIIVCGVSSYTPNGLLRKVVRVKKRRDSIELYTTQASLCDAVENCFIRLHGTIDDSTKGDIEKNFDETFQNALNIKGHFKANISYVFDLQIEGFTIKYIEFKNTLSEELFFKITAYSDINHSDSKKIWSKMLKPHTFNIGVFPFVLVFTPVIDLYVGNECKIFGSASWGLTQKAGMEAGIKYDNGQFKPIKSFSHSFNPGKNVKFVLRADAKEYIQFQLNYLLYNVVGPNLSIIPYVKANGDIDLNPWWEVSAGLGVDAGIKVQILSKTLVDESMNLLDLNRKLLIAGPKNLSAIAGNEQVELKWDDGYIGADKFTYYMSTNENVSKANYEQKGECNTNPFIVNNLTNETKYYFTLTATHSRHNLESEESKVVSVTPKSIEVDFVGEPTNGNAPLLVNYTSTTNLTNIEEFLWDFGYGGQTSGDSVSSFTYTEPGIYNVSLNIKWPEGDTTIFKDSYIIVDSSIQPPPDIDFEGSPLSGEAPLTVEFRSYLNPESGPVNEWRWKLGDGSVILDENPTFTYNSPGQYTVILEAEGPGGVDEVTKIDYVDVIEIKYGYVNVRALNPEGVDITTIEGIVNTDVSIYSDNRFIGYASETIRLPSGGQNIKAMFNGMAQNEFVTITANVTTTLTFSFLRKQFNLENWITNLGVSGSIKSDTLIELNDPFVKRFGDTIPFIIPCSNNSIYRPIYRWVGAVLKGADSISYSKTSFTDRAEISLTGRDYLDKIRITIENEGNCNTEIANYFRYVHDVTVSNDTIKVTDFAPDSNSFTDWFIQSVKNGDYPKLSIMSKNEHKSDMIGLDDYSISRIDANTKYEEIYINRNSLGISRCSSPIPLYLNNNKFDSTATKQGEIEIKMSSVPYDLTGKGRKVR